MFTKALFAAAYIAADALAQQEFMQPRQLQDVEKPKHIPYYERATGPDQEGWFRSVKYMAKNRADKLDDLWSMLQIDESHGEKPQDYRWSEQPQLFTQSFEPIFCSRHDELQRAKVLGWKVREKTTHTQGVVAKVSWEPVENEGGYTGVFETGSEHVIMRLSDTVNQTVLSEGLMPSMALKFLIDGVESGDLKQSESQNIFAMPSFQPSDSWDFFKEPFRNRVKPFDPVEHPIDVLTTQKKLVQANPFPFGTAISHIANRNLDGTLIDKVDVKVPYEIEFRGRRHFADDKVEGVEWYDQMKEFEVGDTIFDVWALVAPETYFGFHIKIAEIKLQTELYASKQGDNRLFFRHERIQQDMKYWHWCWLNLREDISFDDKDPNMIWGSEVPAEWPMEDQEAAKDKYIDQIEKYGCPFAWLLELN